jgi:hypothetical protein
MRKIGNWFGIALLIVSLFGFGTEIIRVLSAENATVRSSTIASVGLVGGLWTFAYLVLWFGLVSVVSSVIELLCDVADNLIERNRKQANKSMDLT